MHDLKSLYVEVNFSFPPTVNNYYVKTRNGIFISSKGREYRKKVARDALEQLGDLKALSERLAVTVTLFPPDKRVRDLDNYMKGLLDALTNAGLWLDDGLIDQLHIYRGNQIKGGKTLVVVEPAVDLTTLHQG